MNRFHSYRNSVALSLAIGLSLNTITLSSAAESEANSNLVSAVSSIQIKDLKKSVAFLASDALEGREAGSEGSRAAAVYLIEQMEKFGLKPVGDDETYRQSFGKNYQNLLGLLPGSDPDLADEIIVVGAHYDHVGYGYSGNSRGTVGQIHNGADDNGRGVAASLEFIEAASLLETAPRRSILFVFWDAEELGLLGSKHWTTKPTINLNRVKYYINLDMVGRLTDNELEVYGSRTADGLRRLYSSTNEDGIRAKFNWYLRPDSDHYSFLQKNIPFVMPFTKKHVDYHRASDDFDKVNFDGHAKIARHWFRILWQLANTDELPGFRRKCLAENEGVRRNIESALSPAVSRLGVSWNTEQSEQAGELIIRNLVSTSPAWTAGLRPGDRILALNGRPFKNSAVFVQNVYASEADSEMTIRRAQSEESEQLFIQLKGQPVLLGLAFRADNAETHSLIVSHVVSDSPAANAGLQRNDRIILVSEKPVYSTQQSADELLGAQKPIMIEFSRDGVVSKTKLQPLKRISKPTPKAESETSTNESSI